MYALTACSKVILRERDYMSHMSFSTSLQVLGLDEFIHYSLLKQNLKLVPYEANMSLS